MKQTLTIRARLFVLVAAIALPMIGILIYTVYDNAERRTVEAKFTAQTLALSASADVDRMLLSNRDLLIQLAKRPQVRRIDAAHCDQVLMDFRELFPKSANMTVERDHSLFGCSATGWQTGLVGQCSVV